jgi:dihydrolipoamide dehydrogenase
MQQINTDVAIIGAGTAGINAFFSAKENGVKPLLIEKGPIGTTSIRSGCVPTQLLRELSITKNNTKPAAITLYGKKAEQKIENDEILNILRNKRTTFFEDFFKQFYTIPDDEKLIGNAFFKDSHTLAIENTDIEIYAKTVILATGSEPVIPYNLQRLGNQVITTNQLFELPTLPKSIAVFGTGSIGLELGQTLSRLGVKTIIFGQNNLWHLTDQKVANEALSSLKEKAFINLDCKITGIENDDNNVKIYYLDETLHECFINVEYILCATGRKPNIDTLKLHSTGIIHDSEGIPYANPHTMQTNIPHIFIAGDVSTNNGCLQNAISQGKLAGLNASVYPNPPITSKVFRQEIIFTDPQMAIVGLNYNEVNEKARSGKKYIIGEGKVKNNTMAKIECHNFGLIHTYFEEESSLFIGAEICAPDAGYIAQFLNCALINKMTLRDLKNLVFYHPSIFEMLSEAFADADKKFKLISNNR